MNLFGILTEMNEEGLLPSTIPPTPASAAHQGGCSFLDRTSLPIWQEGASK